jgi:hypothetical protein
MTTINAVTVVPQYGRLLRPGAPKPRSAFLETHPGRLLVGVWERGKLSLHLPDGPVLETHDSECPDVDRAVRAAERVWNTAAGRAAVERHIAKGGGAPMLDWGYMEASEAADSGIDSVCGTGVSLERVTEAFFTAVVTKLAEVHGEHGAHKIVSQWYDEMFADVGCGYFGPVFLDPDDIDPEDIVS